MAGTEGTTETKPASSDEPESGMGFPRWAVYVLVPGLLLPVLILGFIFFSELAHDESRCPYEVVVQKPLPSGLSVREDRRRCLPLVEERRYTAIREAGEVVLGRRRFAPEAFDKGEYGWSAELGDDGQIRVFVHNPGHTDATFREGTPDERVR